MCGQSRQTQGGSIPAALVVESLADSTVSYGVLPARAVKPDEPSSFSAPPASESLVSAARHDGPGLYCKCGT